MKRLVFVIITALTALILAGSFFLPMYITGLKDKTTLGHVDVRNTQSVSFETKPELGIIDRLRMKNSSGSLMLYNGKNMDAQEACQDVLTELGKFNSNALFDIDLQSCAMTYSSVEFLIDSSDPAKNVIVWNISLEDQSGNMVTASVDDETGILLSVNYRSKKLLYYEKKVLLPAKVRDLDTMLKSIGSYYGVQASLDNTASYEKGLVVQLSDGEKSVDTVIIDLGSYFVFNL